MSLAGFLLTPGHLVRRKHQGICLLVAAVESCGLLSAPSQVPMPPWPLCHHCFLSATLGWKELRGKSGRMKNRFIQKKSIFSEAVPKHFS